MSAPEMCGLCGVPKATGVCRHVRFIGESTVATSMTRWEELVAEVSEARNHAATVSDAVAEARMREHYRPVLVALGTLAWEQHGRLSVPGPLARTVLAEWGITGPLADECIAAAEAES